MLCKQRYGPSHPGAFTFVNEDTPTYDPKGNPRIERLLNAEKAVTDNGGCCLRLAGLYNERRGAHNYWITSGKTTIDGSPKTFVNQLHYDDAASACISTLQAGPDVTKSKIYLFSDGNPMTRIEILESALENEHYKNYDKPEFEKGPNDEDGSAGHMYENSQTRDELKWEPKYTWFGGVMSGVSK